ncbi:Trehalose recp and/or 7tm 7 domain containing protein [Asbolus verrucosus]|uniref:Trehalose recp and/or 7tm 7 domain containing protein n=1 Tax=Asbolus verrucosus TaxID=1661398 RepID=A0A482W528_ASBVE|nr:Trehalose recp and/or 7tm 7 domain containing protein [Asbolus verrucosus]
MDLVYKDFVSSFMFNANSAVSGIIFFKLARKWPLLMEKWSKVELSLENYGNNNRYQKRKFVVIISVIMSAAIVEHILSILHVSQIPNENSNKLEAYFLTNYPHLFNFFEFSIPLAIFATVMNICNVFSWNFLDAFLIIISIALTEKFHQVNDEIHIQRHWMKLREDYNKISILCKIVNKEIADLILVSFATNMFFIMSQLYWSLNQHKTTTIESIYFCFSFGLLVLRTVAVTLYASNINDESKKSMSYLFSLNSNTYNSEIERFAYQIHCQPVALTGHDFFKITRGLLFSMAGAIVTYELFLVQSNIVASY